MNFGSVLKDQLLYKGPIHRGMWGIEVETEALKPYDDPGLKYWDCKGDGSLRNFGREYVAKAPLATNELDAALGEIAACDKKFKFVKDSISTSVHVHSNMLNETPLTIANIFTAYALVENLLIKLSGPDRLSNLFCLSLCDAEGNVDNIELVLKGLKSLNYKKIMLNTEAVKYAALNVGVLPRLGTIEFRSFRGETNMILVKEWVLVLEELIEFARTPGLTPRSILNMYNDMGPEVVDRIFRKNNASVRQGMNLAAIDNMITIKNLRYAARFATVTDRWDDSFGLPKPKPVYREKVKGKLQELAQSIFAGKQYDDLDFAQRLVVEERFLRANPNNRIIDAVGDM